MKTLKNFLFVVTFFVCKFFTHGQVKTTIEVAPGVLIDSTVGYGANLNGRYYFKNLPFSLGVGIGYYRNEKRTGIEYDYSYFAKSGLISSLNLNYLAINSLKGFSLDLSSRLVHLSTSKDYYSSRFNLRKMVFDVNDNKLNNSNFGIGFSTVFKYRFMNESAFSLHLGADYLFGTEARLIETVNVGFEIPLTRWKESSLYKPKLVESKKKAKQVIAKISDVEKETTVKPVPKNVEVISSATKIKTTNDSVKKQIIQEKNLIALKDTISSVKKQEQQVIEVKNEKLKVKSETVQPKINKEANVVQKVSKTSVDNNNDSFLKMKKTAPTISTPKFQGPLNISGNQFELGDDWNYWKGNNELWYAKHKDKEKWYDLIQSLSDENYKKASQILIKEAKQVE